MPKDWKRHKAELECLYITERKPLQEVRQILRDRHGFIASIRAYRMRFDEWGFRKYSTGKDEEPAKALPRGRPLALKREVGVARKESRKYENSSSSDDDDIHIHFPGGIRIPMRPMEVADLLRFIPQHSKYTFEILLMKWQKDGQYLKTMAALLEKVEYHPYIWTRTAIEFPGEWLLNLIQRKTSDEEQNVLIKLLLRFGSSFCYLPVNYWHELSNWISALEASSWGRAKEHLNRHGTFSAAFGQKALEHALVVLAEKYLLEKHVWLEHLNPANGDAETSHEYLEILDHFEEAEIDVDRVWYKYGLQIRKECQAASQDSIRARSGPAEEMQVKYRRLIASYTGFSEEEIDRKVDGLLKDEAATKSRSKVPNASLGDGIYNPSHLPNNSIEPSSTVFIPNEDLSDKTISVARITLKKLLVPYLSGVKLNSEVVQRTLSAMNYVPLFYYRNIFEIIPEEVEKRDQIPFATALMTACFKDKLEHSLWPVFLGASFSYQTLESLCSAKSWEHFQTNLKPVEDAISRFEGRWSSAASKLLSDCLVTMVGEPLLFHIETKLRNWHSRALREEYRREFTAILRTFVDRGLEVDRPWLILLFNIMERDASERGGDVDFALEVPFPTQIPAGNLEG